MLLSVGICCLSALSSVTLPACGPAGRRARGNAAVGWACWPLGAWTVSALAAGHVGGLVADTAWRASTVTSR